MVGFDQEKRRGRNHDGECVRGISHEDWRRGRIKGNESEERTGEKEGEVFSAKDLDPVVFDVTNDDPSQMIKGDSLRMIELARPGSLPSKLGDEVSMIIKHLDSVVSPISHHNVSILINCGLGAGRELTIT